MTAYPTVTKGGVTIHPALVKRVTDEAFNSLHDGQTSWDEFDAGMLALMGRPDCAHDWRTIYDGPGGLVETCGLCELPRCYDKDGKRTLVGLLG